jgi:HD superfamily phosphodiesterase
MKQISNVISAMIAYYAGDVRRIHHFLKVYAYAKSIGENENLEPAMQDILEVAAVVHDIGIKVSEEKYNSSAGNHQQIEGPPVAEKMLTELGYDKSFVERVCYLIAHHHTYNNITGHDYQILVEADFLVNLYEDGAGESAILSAKEKIFRTKTGLMYLENCYLNKAN